MSPGMLAATQSGMKKTKLALNREVVRKLSTHALAQVQGGNGEVVTSCIMCPSNQIGCPPPNSMQPACDPTMTQ
ncbi:MAG: class I lanthipeptide [Kofleriaceae bacterium]